MLNFTKQAAIAALATMSLTSIRPAAADDQGRQIAGSILQAVADGLNNANGGVQPGFSGQVVYPPVYPPAGPQYPPVIPPTVTPVVNPGAVAWDSGVTVTGTGVDPWGRPVVQTGQSLATVSAFDPNRGTVDPGSRRSSSSIVNDQFGNTYRETTNSWTSFGVPHSDTTRELITQSSTGVSIQQQQIAKSARGRGGMTTRPQQPRRLPFPRHHR